ncbi:MAG: helix-turn-helix transcriptional regulator [Pirellulales bacterium]|nr:helix-turn-helix transcriptional regulator [Pirellulales bacterium]
MSAVTPLGEKLCKLRAERGFKQIELALRAGVSERTVRAAEKSVPIRSDLLEYLAIALGVSLRDVSVASNELTEMLRWRKNCQTFAETVRQSLFERDAASLLDVAHSDFAIYYFGAIRQVESVGEILGEYYGYDGIKQFVENAGHFWDKSQTGRILMDVPSGSGDIVHLSGYHEFLRDDGQSIWGRFTLIADFDGERIRSLQGMMVPGKPQK